MTWFFSGGFRPSSGRGGSNGGGRSQGWVDYDYDFEAAGIERRGNNNRVSLIFKVVNMDFFQVLLWFFCYNNALLMQVAT